MHVLGLDALALRWVIESGSMCAMDETEVMTCSGADANLQCGAGAMSVPSCQ
jgi:hypothetical protein